MKEQMLQLVTIILGGMIVMILHELPKAMVYNSKNNKDSSKTKRNIYKAFQYVDPIGLILCIATYSGFSKPYMFRIKEKKTNFILGVTGLLALLVIFMVSITLWKFNFSQDLTYSYSTTLEWATRNFPNYLVQSIAMISINMFFVNLIPISTFDVGLIIAGKSPNKYYSIIKNDYLIKMILILAILFNIISSIGSLIIRFFIVI